MKFKVGDRVVITKLTENWNYDSSFRGEVNLNKDAGVVILLYFLWQMDDKRVTVRFDRNVGGWGDENRKQNCCISDLAFAGQEITGKVMVIGEL